MTDAERQALNERIALAVGWTKETPSQSFDRRDVIHKQFLWIPPLGQYENEPLNTHPPDFTREWERAGPLLEELPDDVQIEITINSIPNIEGKFRCAFLRNLRMLGIGAGDTRIEAIAVAFDARKEGEKA